MDKKTFGWINNATNIAEFMLPHFKGDVKQLYVAADNCTLVQQLVGEPKIVAAKISIISHCLPSTIRHDHAVQYADVLGAPIRGLIRHSFRFFADIAMLVKGQRFFAFQGSNVARLAHHMRFPRIYDTSWFCLCWEARDNCSGYDDIAV
jgi:hypothetical protein